MPLFRCSAKLLIMSATILLEVGCANQPVNAQEPPSLPTGIREQSPTDLSYSLQEYHEQWQGTPYLYGGTGTTGIDCSGYVQRIFNDLFDMSLPRTTAQLSHMGEAISTSQLKSGDLVFFKTGDSKHHVGVYLSEMQFVHASTRAGVTTSRLDAPYWQKHFRQTRRIL